MNKKLTERPSGFMSVWTRTELEHFPNLLKIELKWDWDKSEQVDFNLTDDDGKEFKGTAISFVSKDFAYIDDNEALYDEIYNLKFVKNLNPGETKGLWNKNSRGYAVKTITNIDGKREEYRLHRVVMGIKTIGNSGQDVHHLNTSRSINAVKNLVILSKDEHRGKGDSIHNNLNKLKRLLKLQKDSNKFKDWLNDNILKPMYEDSALSGLTVQDHLTLKVNEKKLEVYNKLINEAIEQLDNKKTLVKSIKEI